MLFCMKNNWVFRFRCVNQLPSYWVIPIITIKQRVNTSMYQINVRLPWLEIVSWTIINFQPNGHERIAFSSAGGACTNCYEKCSRPDDCILSKVDYAPKASYLRTYIFTCTVDKIFHLKFIRVSKNINFLVDNRIPD